MEDTPVVYFTGIPEANKRYALLGAYEKEELSDVLEQMLTNFVDMPYPEPLEECLGQYRDHCAYTVNPLAASQWEAVSSNLSEQTAFYLIEYEVDANEYATSANIAWEK